MHTAQDIVAQQQASQAAFLARYRGISGATDYGCPVVETVEAVQARLDDLKAKAKAFRATPLGRFLTAVDELEESGGFAAEALALRGFYSRSLADLREPLDVEAVAGCLRILAPMNVRSARDAVAALADRMVEASRKAA